MTGQIKECVSKLIDFLDLSSIAVTNGITFVTHRPGDQPRDETQGNTREDVSSEITIEVDGQLKSDEAHSVEEHRPVHGPLELVLLHVLPNTGLERCPKRVFLTIGKVEVITLGCIDHVLEKHRSGDIGHLEHSGKNQFEATDYDAKKVCTHGRLSYQVLFQDLLGSVRERMVALKESRAVPPPHEHDGLISTYIGKQQIVSAR